MRNEETRSKTELVKPERKELAKVDLVEAYADEASIGGSVATVAATLAATGLASLATTALAGA